MTKHIPQIVSLNVSPGGIPKQPLPYVRVNRSGLAGDGHNHGKHYRAEQAVSLQDIEKLVELRRQGFALVPGATGENIDVCYLHVNELPIGTILNFSGGVRLEISKIRHPCYVLDRIHPKLKEVIVHRCGVYAKVLQEGFLTVGETIDFIRPSISAFSFANPLHHLASSPPR